MSNAPAPATTRQFGRCPEKGCITRLVVDTASENVTVERFGPARGYVGFVGLPEDAYTAAGVTLIGGGAYCTEHEMPVRFEGVKAVLNDTDCAAKCHEATSPLCKCSCGGANHGMSA